MEKLPENVRGQRVDTLVAWVETALTVSFGDLSEHPDSLQDALNTLTAAVTQLIEAASVIAPSVPPKDSAAFQEWREQQPWRTEFDAMASTLYGLGLGRTEAELEDAKEAVCTAVQLLSRLPEFRERTIDAMKVLDDLPAAWLVRAVMYYRHKQNLKLSNTWNRTADARPGSHRADCHMSPGSDTAKLVEATARAFGIDTPNRTLNLKMLAYKNLYEQHAGGKPEYNDFAHPFRYFDLPADSA